MSMLVWNGSAWVDATWVRVWDGSAWVARVPHFWDGANWMPEDNPYSPGTIRTDINLTWNVAAPTPAGSWHTATKTFNATFGQSYKSNGSVNTYTSNLMQGYYSSTNGNQKSLCGFSVSGFPSGATVTDAKLVLTAAQWYYNAGGTAVIGTHNKTSAPTSWSSSGVNDDRFRSDFSGTGTKTIDVSNTIGQEFVAGTSKGFVFGPGPSNSLDYYGGFVRSGSDRPVLKLTYKWFA
ncbi:hypothetical protein T45_05359 [Streptomyces turgidiscabies]|nr:hypothetical protein T45_05359 [Streptomyces turgidiscabies]